MPFWRPRPRLSQGPAHFSFHSHTLTRVGTLHLPLPPPIHPSTCVFCPSPLSTAPAHIKLTRAGEHFSASLSLLSAGPRPEALPSRFPQKPSTLLVSFLPCRWLLLGLLGRFLFNATLMPVPLDLVLGLYLYNRLPGSAPSGVCARGLPGTVNSTRPNKNSRFSSITLQSYLHRHHLLSC